MPTSYIRELADEGKGSVESLEKKWGEAKEKAVAEGHGGDYAYVTTIFKSMVGASVVLCGSYSEREVEAYARLFSNPESS